MKVYITQGASETAVEIHCTEADDRIGKLKKYIEAYGLTLPALPDAACLA